MSFIVFLFTSTGLCPSADLSASCSQAGLLRTAIKFPVKNHIIRIVLHKICKLFYKQKSKLTISVNESIQSPQLFSDR